MTKITDKPIYLMSEESIACLLLPVWVFTCNCYVEGLETDSIRGDLLTDESMLSLESEQDIMKDSGTSSCVTNHAMVGWSQQKVVFQEKYCLKRAFLVGHFVLKFPESKPLRQGRPTIIKKSYPSTPSAEYGAHKRDTD